MNYTPTNEIGSLEYNKPYHQHFKVNINPAEPRINKNDIITVDTNQNTVANNHLYLVESNGTNELKRVPSKNDVVMGRVIQAQSILI